MEDLTKRGKAFIKEWCDQKHSTTKRIPNLHYEQEEKALLQPLPQTRYRMGELQTRKISPDSYISIHSNKYSVPVKYAGKTMKFRLIYGFRIEIYDRKENKVLTLEKADGKHLTETDPEHYSEIAPKAPTSIPQIRRDFTARFSNGLKYLEAAGRKFDQPTHHARKIMLLEDLYDAETLNLFIGYAVEHDRMDIRSFKELLKEYNAGKLSLDEISGSTAVQNEQDNTGQYHDDDPGLVRSCDYYEKNVGAGT